MPGVGLDIWNEQPGGIVEAAPSATPSSRRNDMYTVPVAEHRSMPPMPQQMQMQMPQQMQMERLQQQRMQQQQQQMQQQQQQLQMPRHSSLKYLPVPQSQQLGAAEITVKDEPTATTEVWQRLYFWIFLGMGLIVVLLCIIIYQLSLLRKTFSKKF